MMDIKSLFTNDDAVSPVIGVILMVAITVILAAVIGAFVLNIGGSQESAPQASLSADYSPDDSNGFESPGSNTDNDSLRIVHDGGGTFDASLLSAEIGGTQVDDLTSASDPVTATQWGSGTAAGDYVEFSEVVAGGSGDTTISPIESGQDVTISWTASSGDSSQIIFESQVP